MGTDDVVDLLLAQHERIRTMLAGVDEASGQERRERFSELRAFLAVHETAEEMVVHPRAREGGAGADVVEARLAEEHSAKEILSHLDGMDVDHADFEAGFAELRSAVIEHAEREEREEFPLLRDGIDTDTRAAMAAAVRAAEAIAPTRPHPGVESATGNLLVGPVASLVDRTRDAVRTVLGKP